MAIRESENLAAVSKPQAIVGFTVLLVLFGIAGFILLAQDGTATAGYSVKAPSNSPFEVMETRIQAIGPQALKDPERRLSDAMRHFLRKNYVPYIYGGKRIGSPAVCKACSACIVAKNLESRASSSRTKHCPVCRACGIDCSNFVSKIFKEANFNYRFAATSTLNKDTPDVLKSRYHLDLLDTNVNILRVGDLLLEKDHVMIVMNIDSYQKVIGIVHASRGETNVSLGGISRMNNYSFERFDQRVLRVLRHEGLQQPVSLRELSLAEWIAKKSLLWWTEKS